MVSCRVRSALTHPPTHPPPVWFPKHPHAFTTAVSTIMSLAGFVKKKTNKKVKAVKLGDEPVKATVSLLVGG